MIYIYLDRVGEPLPLFVQYRPQLNIGVFEDYGKSLSRVRACASGEKAIEETGRRSGLMGSCPGEWSGSFREYREYTGRSMRP